MNQLDSWTRSWWERYPDREASEIRKLVEAKLQFKIDRESRAAGVLRLFVEVPSSVTGSRDLSLEVVFPDLYPHFRPRVIAPADLALAHHHDPFGSDLCLVARGSEMWSEDDSLAWLLTVQLPKVLESAEGRDPAQAEPVSAYFTYASSAVVLVETDRLPPPEATRGTVQLKAPSQFPDGDRHWLASVLGFRWEGSDVAGSRGMELVDGAEVDGTWIRLPKAPDTDVPDELWRIAEAGVTATVPVDHDGDGHFRQIAAILFPEEQADGGVGTGLFFIVRDSDQVPRRARRRPGAFRAARPARHWVVRSSRSGAADLIARAPELAVTSDKHVVLVGCGAVGSVIADSVARSGVRELTLIDSDILEAGNLLRHTGTVRDVGLAKVISVAIRARDARPGLAVNAVPGHIGGTRSSKPVEGRDFPGAFPLAEVAAGDLIIDATAERAVHEVVAEMCRDLGKTYVWVEATRGAWGGAVGVFPPESDACWNCLEYQLQDGALVWPAAQSSNTIQPPGCADPTFTGAHFDLAEVALQGARVAVTELISPDPTGGSSLYSVSLRDAGGQRTPPSWALTSIQRHASCTWHS